MQGVLSLHASTPPIIDLSTASLDLAFRVGETLRLDKLRTDAHDWLHPEAASGLFAVYSGDQRHDAASLRLVDQTLTMDAPDPGLRTYAAVLESGALRVTDHLRVYDPAALVEQWQTIHNTGDQPVTLTRLDSLVLTIPTARYSLLSFNSDWGQEFEPVERPVDRPITLGTRAGRASKGMHPWFALTATDGHVLTGAVAWSGNWIVRFEPFAGGVQISGGLSDWAFAVELAPGESLQTPRFILAPGADQDAAARQYTDVGRRYWYPRNALAGTLPVEWNHWWSYEDAAIDDPVFRANSASAAALGIEICTLDAGWFGPSDDTHWHHVRGDWALVNRRRFPAGIRSLADETHARGMKFGLWCEIEGLGPQAQITRDQPDFPALRDGAPLGYVCLGNPDAQEWAYQTLAGLIRDYGADWLKLDFNVDPGAGCNRADHGHGPGDGLYRHVMGYYAVLDRVRTVFPAVVLENCSSGGLRTDLEMARHTHVTFTSDPDWPVHALQVFWGLSQFIAPEAALRWMYSEWRSPTETQRFDPADPALRPHQLDYYVRIAMLSMCGFSQRLPQLPAWVAARIRQHIALYQGQVRRFIREGTLAHLTDQPRRSGTGERWTAFQYTLPGSDEALLFVFRLPGAAPQHTIRPRGLNPDRAYRIDPLDVEPREARSLSGQDLGRVGLTFSDLEEEGSALLWIYPEPPEAAL
jgi:alpha-galactosidase